MNHLNKSIKIKVRPCGQGDSIIIEWNDDDDIPRIGLIDCNKKNNNPSKIYHYIANKNYERIDFIVMTHPHTDHYSGIEELLNLCLRRNKPIIIKQFIHSCQSSKKYMSSRAYFKMLHKTSELYLKNLRKLFVSIIKFRKEGKIGKERPIGDLATIDLNSSYHLICVSPSDFERDEFEKIEHKKENLYNEAPNNPAANFLSISLALFNKDNRKCMALFTSDCEEKTIVRFTKNTCIDYFPFMKETIPLIQIPHHGSQENHHQPFWENIIIKDSHSFISVGNNQWGHPSDKVIRYFREKHKFSSTAIGQLGKFFNDDRYRIWSKNDAKGLNDDDGVELRYFINQEGVYHFDLS
jgi:beta-lactamase superfamily II metal-dependent hydrolase